jgi:hypothetical protein
MPLNRVGKYGGMKPAQAETRGRGCLRAEEESNSLFVPCASSFMLPLAAGGIGLEPTSFPPLPKRSGFSEDFSDGSFPYAWGKLINHFVQRHSMQFIPHAREKHIHDVGRILQRHGSSPHAWEIYGRLTPLRMDHSLSTMFRAKTIPQRLAQRNRVSTYRPSAPGVFSISPPPRSRARVTTV